MRILYITFTDFGDTSSGSGVRPYKIYKSFIKLGYEVKLLEGQQNKRRERKNKIKEISKWLDYNDVDICYIEPPTGPLFNIEDILLIKKIYKFNIPISIFIRDIFWLYPQFWGVKGIKKIILTLMHEFDMKIYRKYCGIIYCPGQSFKSAIKKYKFHDIRLLPPGCELNESKKSIKTHRKCLYVGACGFNDGIDILINAFKIVNKKNKLELVIVTRKEEMKKLNHLLEENYSWLSIMNVSGEELEPVYNNVDLGIIPRRRHEYMDLAMPIKLMEYIGHQLPVLSTDCTEMATFINNEKCGIVCETNAESMAMALDKVYDDNNSKVLDKLVNSVYESAERNTWDNKCLQIVKETLELKRN